VATFWLLGKADFPYRVDIEAAEALVNATEYWKSAEHSKTNETFKAEDHTELFGVVPSEKIFSNYRKNVTK
jgi:hypothetical protein